VLAEELTREAIFRALKGRRCYATSGPRILLDVTCNGHAIGEAFALDGPTTIHARVVGTTGLDAVEILRFAEGDETARVVAWRSQTTGDEDGVILTLDAPAEATLRFETEPTSFDIPLRDIAAEAKIFPAGGLDQRVTIRRLRDAPAPADAMFQWSDGRPPRGRAAYFVRVRQVDGAVAYTSPFFVARG
jgi:hypothetical protein